MNLRHTRPARARGFSLLEVLVALAILTAGVLAVAAVYPKTLQAGNESQILTEAAALAQMKAEEIRRDNDRAGRLVDAIKSLSNPTDPIQFPREPRLTYSFSNRSLLYTADPTDPRAAPGVPRVVIRYAAEYRKSQDVVYELRFDQNNR